MSRLINADALIADIEKRYCKDCERRKGVKGGKVRVLYEIGEAPCRACGTMDAMDEIDNAPTISEWVSVNDRLPKDGQDVLAYLYNGEETRIAPFNYDKGTWYDCVMNCTVAINSITHWMPLPEPPKEVSE